MRTLILGVGNPVLSDDGVGIHVIEELEKEKLPENVKVEEAGLVGLSIIDIIIDYDRLIIVDAIKSNGEPGTIYELSIEDLSTHPFLHFSSTHEVDFLTALEVGKKLFPEKIPKDITILAIEVKDITTFSEECTPKVKEAIPKVVELIKAKILKKEN
ncbi:MAG: hydrogenase maturation protease [Candidatus Wukongarchaeota archaeon]|nr:hydrogenase maturation protease [Candidatus Wukongarchaeota archaeon]